MYTWCMIHPMGYPNYERYDVPRDGDYGLWMVMEIAGHVYVTMFLSFSQRCTMVCRKAGG